MEDEKEGNVKDNYDVYSLQPEKITSVELPHKKQKQNVETDKPSSTFNASHSSAYYKNILASMIPCEQWSHSVVDSISEEEFLKHIQNINKSKEQIKKKGNRIRDRVAG